jgi:hypothetical protein
MRRVRSEYRIMEMRVFVEFQRLLWYIYPMGLKGLAKFVVLVAILQAVVAVAAKPVEHPTAKSQAAPVAASPAPMPQSAPGTDSAGSLRDYQTPHITIANPPPAPSMWTWQEQVTWAANLVLVVLGYVGIMMALSLLKKIERQTGYAEAVVEAASSSAHAALLNAQAVIHAERPWILITVEPSRSMENSFTVMATNRGRTPARIIEILDRHQIAIDEKRLPYSPEYLNEKRAAQFAPIILLPGEFAAIKPFCRDDVKALCDSEERFKRIETWEEKVFLYGKVVYQDLISASDDEAHETNWCCWYIHGRQNSGLVIAGPHEYNSHT